MKKLIIAIGLVILIIVLAVIYKYNGLLNGEVSSFEECAAARYPIMVSYPRQCSDGTNTFTEVLDAEGQAKLNMQKNEMESLRSANGVESTNTYNSDGTVVNSYDNENVEYNNDSPNGGVSSFEECAAARYPIMVSYPRQCSDGTNTFTEVIDAGRQEMLDNLQ